MYFITMTRLGSVTDSNRIAALAGRSGKGRIHSLLSSAFLFFKCSLRKTYRKEARLKLDQ